MLGPEKGAAPEQVIITDLVVALLHLDRQVGCCEQAFALVRQDQSLRRQLAEQIHQPELRRHALVVDFDDPQYHTLNPDEFHSFDPSLAGRPVPVDRNGRHALELVEIYPGRVLSTAQQLKLIDLLGFRPPGWIEARAALNGLLKDAAYPIMALCGAGQALTATADTVVGILQVEAGRMLAKAYPSDRWSQEYRLLAVAEA